ncbi:DUF1638 domain-containing protein [Oscillospiraceae bacterium CM]|nr:DUF1638 domain-containing protein [Oscillospiraceae bacterium CM]
MPNVLMIACPTIKQEVNAIANEINAPYPIYYLPELHVFPDKLNDYLKDMLSRLCNVDYVLLPMGQCGKSTFGLRSDSATLVLPRCEDCTDLLLSEKTLGDIERPKYTYFFTDGWLENGRTFIREYQWAIDKYGDETADDIMQTLYRNYQYFAYTDTGVGDYDACCRRVKPLADTVGATINRLRAPHGVLKKMMRLQFDGDFVLVPPGEMVTQKLFEKNVARRDA